MIASLRAARNQVVLGVFVGGRGARMGGSAKGLLATPADGEPFAARLVRLARPLGEVVLVGDGRAYATLGVAALPDAVVGIGPLGGLLALLRHAERAGAGVAIALACDMAREVGSRENDA